MSDYPCPDCGYEGRGVYKHRNGCPRDTDPGRTSYTGFAPGLHHDTYDRWRRQAEDKYWIMKQQLPVLGLEPPDFSLEEPTGKGRFNVKKTAYELTPALHRCVCAFCLRVAWSPIFYGVCKKCTVERNRL